MSCVNLKRTALVIYLVEVSPMELVASPKVIYQRSGYIRAAVRGSNESVE